MGGLALSGLVLALCTCAVSGYIGLCSSGTVTNQRNGELRYRFDDVDERTQECQCNITANDEDVFVHFVTTLQTDNYDNCQPYIGYKNFQTSFLLYSCPSSAASTVDIEVKQGHDLGISVLNGDHLAANFNITFKVFGGSDVTVKCAPGLLGAIVPFPMVAGATGMNNPNDGAILAVVLIVLILVIIFIAAYCKVRCRDRKRKKNRDEDKLENSQVTATTGPEDNSAFEFTPKSSNTDLSRTANGYKPYPYNSPYHGQPNNGPTPYNPQAAITGFGIPPANAGPYRPADLQPYRPSQPIERPSQPIERPSQPIERPSQPIERPLQFSSLPPPGYTQDTPVRPPQTPEEFEPQQPYYVNRNAPGPQRSAPAPRGPPQSRAPNTSPPNTNPMRPYTPEQIEPQRAPPVNAAPVRSYPQDNRAFTPDDPGTSRAYTPDNRGPPQRPYTPDNRDSPRPFYPEPGHTPRSGTPDTRPTPAATPTPTSTAPLPPMARAPSQSSIPGSLARAPSQSSIPGHMARAPSQSSIPGSMARAPSQSSIPGVMARAPSKSSLGPRDPILYPYPSPPDSPASSRAESLDSSFYSNSAPRSRQDAYHTPPQTTPEGLRGPRASSMSPYVGTFSAAPAAPPDETTV